MRKRVFCRCEIKDADQLGGDRFVSDQVRNPEDRFSHIEAQLLLMPSWISPPLDVCDPPNINLDICYISSPEVTKLSSCS